MPASFSAGLQKNEAFRKKGCISKLKTNFSAGSFNFVCPPGLAGFPTDKTEIPYQIRANCLFPIYRFSA